MEPLMIVLTILAIGMGLYHYLLRGMSYFKEKDVPHVPPIPIFGNIAPYIFRRKPLQILLQDFYCKFSNAKYFGFFDFTKSIIIIRDPELINSIAIKNFNNFCDHTSFFSEHEIILSKNLFELKGDTWREMRKTLSPTFTLSKMKMMFGLIEECAKNFINHVTVKAENGWTVEMKDIFVRYTNDAVASTAFGISIDSMKNPNNEFFTHITKALNFEGIVSLKIAVSRHFPNLFRKLNIKIFGEKVCSFFRDVLVDTVQTRERENIIRPDMIQLMMESGEKLQMSYDDMTSQAFLFFLAGADSLSVFVCFAAHELAVNTEIQKKLREEIDQVLQQTNGQPTYDAIMNMKYLDAVISEALRLYPLGAFVDRYCVKSFELPAPTPEGKPLTVTPGMTLWFLPYSLHRDPKYFPDPEKFDPNRFLDDNNIDPMTYLPFGVGPRVCIGNRYALMLSKVLIFHLIARCELERCSKTMVPIELSKKSFIMTANKGFWLKIKTRK